MSFMIISAVKATFFLGLYIFLHPYFHTYCPIWVKFSTSDLNRLLLSIGDYHKNQHRQSKTSHSSIYKVTFMCVSTSFSM
jgi:hypothetical protein